MILGYRRHFSVRNLRILIPAGCAGIALAWATASWVPDQGVELIECHSLQKGDAAEVELTLALADGWNGLVMVDHTDLLTDFAETAALIDNLDLVISVDTSTAHLAAAMGKPVWLLNRYDTCWRWLLDNDDSPWYPTLRL